MPHGKDGSFSRCGKQPIGLLQARCHGLLHQGVDASFQKSAADLGMAFRGYGHHHGLAAFRQSFQGVENLCSVLVR